MDKQSQASKANRMSIASTRTTSTTASSNKAPSVFSVRSAKTTSTKRSSLAASILGDNAQAGAADDGLDDADLDDLAALVRMNTQQTAQQPEGNPLGSSPLMGNAVLPGRNQNQGNSGGAGGRA